jgi:hypothetical protein
VLHFQHGAERFGLKSLYIAHAVGGFYRQLWPDALYIAFPRGEVQIVSVHRSYLKTLFKFTVDFLPSLVSSQATTLVRYQRRKRKFCRVYKTWLVSSSYFKSFEMSSSHLYLMAVKLTGGNFSYAIRDNRKITIMPEKQQYMVDFTLPAEFSPEFTALIPAQRTEVNRLMAADKIASYSLSLDSGKLWAIVNAESELEVLIMINNLPLSRFMESKIALLTFHNTVTKIQTAFSLN